MALPLSGVKGRVIFKEKITFFSTAKVLTDIKLRGGGMVKALME